MTFIRRARVIILCAILGAVIVLVPAIASFHGLFVKWEPIETPPEKAVEILEIDYFRSNTGKIYHLYYDATCRSGCWEMVERLPGESEYLILPLDDCDAFPFLPFTNEFVQSKKSCIRWGIGTDMMAQAIDSNGMVYSWDHRLTEFTSLSLLLSVVYGTILGGMIGLLITLIQNTKLQDSVPKAI